MIVFERAPAKINLGLKILGKRPDGYHDILSIFQTVDLCDELTLSDESGPGFECESPTVPRGPDNLVLRAERVLASAAGEMKPIRYTLRKRIPVGAGLGGGSSDAAAALRGLGRIYGGGASNESVLSVCAEKLGSDVPFLLKGGTAVVSGRGELIRPVDWPFDFTYVIVYPGFGVSTAWAYGRVNSYEESGGEYASLVRGLAGARSGGDEFIRALLNDFEKVVFPAYPELGGIRSMLLKGGAAAALLTGSGSSLFGIFDEPEMALLCADTVRERGLSAWVVRALPPHRRD